MAALVGTVVVGAAVLTPSSAHAVQTVHAPTSCTFAQTHSGPGARQGVTFVAPMDANVLASVNIGIRNSAPSGTANEFRVQLQEWDLASAAAVGPVIAESASVAASGFEAEDAWADAVDLGLVPIDPGASYVVHVSGEGSAGISLYLCLAAAPLSGSALVSYDTTAGWSTAPVTVPAGFSATFLLRPSVTSVTPEALPGETITIVGSGFDSALTTEVTIDGIPVAFTVVSETELTAIVPAAASAGLVPVQVTSDTLLSEVTSASQVLVLTPPAPPAPPTPPVPPVTPPSVPPALPEPPVVPVPEPPAPAVQLEPAASGGDRVDEAALAPTGTDPRLAVVGVLAALVTTAGGALVWAARRARMSASR